MRIRFAIAMLFAALAGVGCGGAENPLPPVEYPAPLTSGDDAADGPQAAEGVTLVEFSCTEGAPEACNGVDDDCDGRVDEDCGFGGGAVQITATWNSGADLDLVITPPDDAADGGIDHDGRSACAPDADHARIADASFAEATPGRWRVAISTADACGHEGPTTASVSVSFGGHAFGPFNRTLDAGEEAEILTFDVP